MADLFRLSSAVIKLQTETEPGWQHLNLSFTHFGLSPSPVLPSFHPSFLPYVLIFTHTLTFTLHQFFFFFSSCPHLLSSQPLSSHLFSPFVAWFCLFLSLFVLPLHLFLFSFFGLAVWSDAVLLDWLLVFDSGRRYWRHWCWISMCVLLWSHGHGLHYCVTTTKRRNNWLVYWEIRVGFLTLHGLLQLQDVVLLSVCSSAVCSSVAVFAFVDCSSFSHVNGDFHIQYRRCKQGASDHKWRSSYRK